MATSILQIALPTPLRRLFDYLPPEGIDLSPVLAGVRVRVPFGARTLVGVVVAVVAETEVPMHKLKRAQEVLDTEPLLPEDVYKLCEWAAEYYHYALGEVIAAAMPVLLRKGEATVPKPSRRKSQVPDEIIHDEALSLNAAQQSAVDAICQAQHTFNVFLLDGVTGSGKTEVYLQTMREVVGHQKQVLVLVPEISLTPQTIQRFRARFSVPVVALHSGLSEAERLQGWLQAKSGEAKIVIGTRSAIFTPFANLGLIVVDEEHDSSFKQQDRFRYHARDLAIMRASIIQIPVVLGSATPSLESLHNAKRGRYQYLSLPERAGHAQLPLYQLIDLKKTTQEEGLSQALLQNMRTHLAQGNQVMLFLNRRGFAPVLYCSQCAWIAECKRCDARLVYHRPGKLQCHHCDARHGIPAKCEQCQQASLQPVGFGTQRLEEMLQQHFPDVPIIRVDRDSTRKKGAMQTLLNEIHDKPQAILLGTQMLAKGHHFPNVTLVGVIDADSGLFSADFRAIEQMGQLLLQVAGRAGRADKPGTVMIQTQHPDHPLLQLLINAGYNAFATALLTEREQSLLPPYSYFAVFRAEAYAQGKAADFLDRLKKLGGAFQEAVTVLGPVPALMAKKKGLHCQNLLIKANKRSVLQYFLKEMLQQIENIPAKEAVKWILDVDPVEVV